MDLFTFILDFFSRSAARFYLGVAKINVLPPPPTASKMYVLFFFLVSIAIEREKLLFVVFLSSGSVETFDPNNRGGEMSLKVYWDPWEEFKKKKISKLKM